MGSVTSNYGHEQYSNYNQRLGNIFNYFFIDLTFFVVYKP
jgi:hypothetical protein